ncbi:MAG: hypothetical protein JO006_15880 [Paucibacter sp.]|nr:hypothetical protein [Roseateles sp.]
MFKKSSPKALGDAAEDRTLTHLLAPGLRWVERNYRVVTAPSRGGWRDDHQRQRIEWIRAAFEAK